MVENVSRDERIGSQVSLLRGHRDMAQTALAEAMKARGHQKWSQATVWAVEKGTRPVRLAEAVDLAWILGVLIDDLVDPHEGEARYQQEVTRAKTELTAVMQSIERRLGNLQHDSLVDVVQKAQRRWAAKSDPDNG